VRRADGWSRRRHPARPAARCVQGRFGRACPIRRRQSWRGALPPTSTVARVGGDFYPPRRRRGDFLKWLIQQGVAALDAGTSRRAKNARRAPVVNDESAPLALADDERVNPEASARATTASRTTSATSRRLISPIGRPTRTISHAR
jgi:hypothetical protein